MNIGLDILDRQFKLYQSEYEAAALKVLRSGRYILGTEVEKFEQAFAACIGSKYSVGVASGLDALTLALKALDITVGDEVIVPANTYIATVLAITANGATPIFIEPDEFYNIDADRIEEKITARTKCIMVVHLYGQAANFAAIKTIADRHNLPIVEDCAQSHGAHYEKNMTGNLGTIGCFSFYPTKNLGAFGDGGAIATSDSHLADKIKMLRNYGSREKYHNELAGVNSRLDEIQAALLNVKLKHLPELITERKNIAQKFLAEIKNPLIKLPQLRKNSEHVYHQFVVRTANRDKFKKYLTNNGIATVIHYPIPPHLAKCYEYLGHQKGDYPIAEKYANTVLSLPIFNGMTDKEINYVIDICNNYQEVDC